MINLDAVLTEVLTWLEPIGEVQLEGLRKGDLNIVTKSHRVDFVTDYDVRSEKMLVQKISENYPDHAILGEEGSSIENGSDYRWVIDPIDGTTNYSHGFPFFCISIALQYRSESVLGVVYAPMLRQTFTAIRGQGAQLNGRPIRVSKSDTLLCSLISTGFPYTRESKNVNIDYFLRVINCISGIRRSGSAALDLCMVAAGMLDAYWEFNLKDWDVAAGDIIVREAGGSFEQIEVGEDTMTLASNRLVYDELVCCLFNRCDNYNKVQLEI